MWNKNHLGDRLSFLSFLTLRRFKKEKIPDVVEKIHQDSVNRNHLLFIREQTRKIAQSKRIPLLFLANEVFTLKKGMTFCGVNQFCRQVRPSFNHSPPFRLGEK